VNELPAVFVTHGAPTLPLDDTPARTFLASLGARLGKPDAILCISAHWESDTAVVSTTPEPRTIHDFFGFPPALYELGYPAPGAPAVAARAAGLLAAAGIPCAQDASRGLDHGAWTPLLLMYPDADVPTTQLTVLPAAGAAAHIAIGRALTPLRREGVLILASGSATHNLREFRGQSAATPALDYVRAFDDWLVDAIESGDEPALVDYRARAPQARRNHPTEEHFLPLFVAVGAGGLPGQTLHRGASYGILAMTAFAFGGPGLN